MPMMFLHEIPSLSSHVSFRMLWTEYPQESATFAIDDEFLIGESQLCFISLFAG